MGGAACEPLLSSPEILKRQFWSDFEKNEMSIYTSGTHPRVNNTQQHTLQR